MSKVKILYFIAGYTPTEEETKIKDEMLKDDKYHMVSFRNSQFDCGFERCNLVYGLIPEQYESVPIYGVSRKEESPKPKVSPVGKKDAWKDGI